MSAPMVLPATSEGCAHSSAGPVGPAEDRPRGVTAHSALGHVLRRLEREAEDPTASHLAEFESSIDFETPMW